MSRTLEQNRAKVAWEAVNQIDGNLKVKYKSLATSAPADIQANGLGQTLAFWRAKGETHHMKLYNSVSDWVKGFVGWRSNEHLLQWVSNTASTDEYRRATAEAIAFLIWVKRFAEAELE